MNKEQLEQMPMSELEQYIQSHPYGQYYKYMTAWYVYARRLLNGNGCPERSGESLGLFRRTCCRPTQFGCITSREMLLSRYRDFF